MNLRYAADKLALMLALVPYLDDIGQVSVVDAAAHFSVKPAEIIEAVKLIAMSGVPSVGNVPMHNDMFDIDWDALETDGEIVLVNTVALDEVPRFSRGEASALIAGLQYLAGLPGSAENDVLPGLMQKLAAAGNTGVTVTTEANPTEPVRVLLAQAQAAGERVRFDYANPNGATESRLVDPLQLLSDTGVWYLRGWCQERGALRLFRLDRMNEVKLTGEPVSAEHSVDASETLFDAGSNDFSVTLEVARAGLPLLGDFAQGANIPKQGDPVTIDVRVAHVHGLKRVVAAHPELMRVLSPASAVETVAEWARAGLTQAGANSQAARG